MSSHTLILTLDSIEQAKLDAGEFVFPEHEDGRAWRIRCDDPAHCDGYIECHRQHICPHGHDACNGFDENSEDGPCPGHADDDLPNCFSGDEEFTFHGQAHTYRWGWGWTVPFIGCVVAENWDGELDRSIYTLPIGEYPVDEDWYDDSGVTLTLTAAA